MPFTGDPAVNYAQKMLTRQRSQATLSRTFSQYLQKASPTIRFNKDYAPTQESAASAKPAGPAKAAGTP